MARDRTRARVPAELAATAPAELSARSAGALVVARVTRRRGLPAFEVFLEANRASVYRYLVAAVGPVEADDVFQDTFLAALRAYPRCTEAERLDRWILRIASRKAIDHHRGAAVDADPAADGLGPAVEAVRDLPSRQRDAVAYRHVLGFSVAETASLMGTTEETVRANAYQGLKRLKERARWQETSPKTRTH